ncbi:hypothetical protein FNO01nite_05340 [Flavobacterium noncentrifugens]|uniref:Por secretion system C-terminal sorting domain-containing protein n=1 Tax=Flavobacterium noncentrifugens TaxID=1128970 RepID=A0A1G8SJY4_9FLAO|nr:laminin B domain-containing protein [Flavobacterium noncentrifugens]GEP49862.1 hypothetical protein FNO01nite_05340 [Flavobacterium noncentrifugens]SDJ29473.1 Por secretion system C-terminal sorting domain-containing protein [Flavobacterium noncentrifugens]
MRKIFTTATLLLLNVIYAQTISSTFDSGIDNWLVVGDATSANPNFIAEGGNPGGYLSADDTAAGGVWFWLAPAKFLGNQNTSFGKILSFDLKQSSTSSQFDDSDIVIASSGLTIALDLAENPGIDWTHYAVRLDATNAWKINTIADATLATSEEILAVLSDVTSLKIRGEYINGSDTGGLDNVLLGTDSLDAKSFSAVECHFYPNPATNNIYFSENVDRVLFYDLLGKKMNLDLQNQTVDVSQLSNGMYTIRMESGTKSQTKKFIKK